MIETPSLALQFKESPQVLDELVRSVSLRCGGDEAFSAFAIEWIGTHLKTHAWPGNYRELEQCVRNLLIRGQYYPPQLRSAGQLEWLSQAPRGALSADDLLNAYCRHVYAQTGTYEASATKLGLDRRTVRARVEN